MIKQLILNKYPLIWILFHIALGLSATFSPIPVIVWFYLVIITSLGLILKRSESPFILIGILLYLISFELLARMARTSPFIPYELGKYLLCAGMIWGILKYKTGGKEGWIMLLCLVPAIFIDVTGQVVSSDLVFNILGPVNVALVIVFFYKQQVTTRQLSHLLRMIVYPMLGVLGYTIIKSPDFKEVEFALGANVDWSGGFGSNQVSTLFGLGAFFMFILMINRWKFSGYVLIDALVLFAFSFQGLLTFSRGGMLGAVLGIMVVLFFLRGASLLDRKKYKLPKIGKYVLPAILVAVVAYLAVDEITGGMLSLRYQGETMGTLEGSKVKSLNSVTTGRFEIFEGDINLWTEHFFLGVGAGASRFIRETMTGTVAHVELSRLLAEHGLLGLIYFLILCRLGFQLFKSNPNPLIRGILMALFVVAMYTTFHAAMRTFVTPALIGLSLLSVKLTEKKKPVQQVSPRAKVETLV
ncbi:O-antigen ligase domain-containing protein [Algoriphagus lacus]|uniref:O-antigen ligase domain-containing protein n=1 Tax=Algoriphagus lacus TaxID=2056311 RepID=A0A418PLZ2_9BACT|nr:O-antigen ligase domain-containing protein [Algoriphagus lacus]